MEHDYAIFLHVLNTRGQKVVQRDTIIRGADYPTSRWAPGELVIDLADLPLRSRGEMIMVRRGRSETCPG